MIDPQSSQPMLSLNEVALLGLADDFSGLANQLLVDGECCIRDREGTYSLVFSVTGDDVNVRDEFTGQGFGANRSQLIEAFRDFAERLGIRLRQLFPELRTNPSFGRVTRRIRQRLSATSMH